MPYSGAEGSFTLQDPPFIWVKYHVYWRKKPFALEHVSFPNHLPEKSDTDSETCVGYPLNVNSSFYVDSAGEVGINGTITRGLDYDVYGASVFPSGIQSFNITTPSYFDLAGDMTYQSIQLSASLPSFSGALLSTTQTGTAEYFSGINSSYSFGTTTQDFDFKGVEADAPGMTYELYKRHVMAVNSTITEDEQTLAGETFGVPVTLAGENVPTPTFEGFSVRSLLGRGPGQPKAGLMGGGGS